MKRFHVHAHAQNLQASIAFCSNIPVFGRPGPAPVGMAVKAAGSSC